MSLLCNGICYYKANICESSGLYKKLESKAAAGCGVENCRTCCYCYSYWNEDCTRVLVIGELNKFSVLKLAGAPSMSSSTIYVFGDFDCILFYLYFS